jgi:hypothetical protein
VEIIEGPGDVEGRIVPDYRAFTGGVIEISRFVKNFGGVREDKKAVSKTFRDPEQLEVVVRRLRPEVKACPFTEVGGFAAKVDGNVPDMTGEHAHEFALRSLNLVMQAAEHTFDRKGLVVLDKLVRKTNGGKC